MSADQDAKPARDPKQIEAELESHYRRLEKAIPLMDGDDGTAAAAFSSTRKLFKVINTLEEDLTGTSPELGFRTLLERASSGSSNEAELKEQLETAVEINTELKTSEEQLLKRIKALEEENAALKAAANKADEDSAWDTGEANHQQSSGPSGHSTTRPQGLSSAFNQASSPPSPRPQPSGRRGPNPMTT